MPLKQNKIIVAPSILAADFLHLEQEIKAVEAAGADWIHIDVMDGHFVPNLSMGPSIVKAIRQCTQLPLDVHLMVSNPEQSIDLFSNTGANFITIHAEASPHLHRCIQKIHSYGIKAGVSLTPSSPISCIEHIIQDMDLLLLMTVNPGFGGQAFIESMLGKIKDAQKIIKQTNSKAILQVDGGVNIDNAKNITQAGANCLVAGSAIFKSKDYSASIKKLQA